jgi:hypothetical protein
MSCATVPRYCPLWRRCARVTEQVDVAGLKPAAARRTGSIPVPRTKCECKRKCNKSTKHKRKSKTAHRFKALGPFFAFGAEVFGGAIRSRTGLDGFAIRCITALLSRQGRLMLPSLAKRKGSLKASLLSKTWSGKRDSNSRPQPWQGCALPTELFPQGLEAALDRIQAMRRALHYRSKNLRRATGVKSMRQAVGGNLWRSGFWRGHHRRHNGHRLFVRQSLRRTFQGVFQNLVDPAHRHDF